MVECSLPAPDKLLVEREVRKRLKAFQDGALQEPTKIQVFNNLAIELSRAGQLGPHYFLSGGLNHSDSGELVSEELERNREICIAAKAKKLSYLRSKHRDRKCWLALVDLISQGYMDARDITRTPAHDWDKIIMINPLDPKQSFDLP
jgi:hypothetical protein